MSKSVFPTLSAQGHIQINTVKLALKHGVKTLWVVNEGVFLHCSRYFLLFLKL